MQSIPGDLLDIDRKDRSKTPSMELELRNPAVRVCDFDEVILPFDAETAMYEAARCIHCPDPAPCVRACPTTNDIPSAMWLIEKGEFIEAAKLYRQSSSLPEICSRVCPHEILCEGACVVGKQEVPVLTGQLERFVVDLERQIDTIDTSTEKANGHKVAVVGAGPAGLSAAEALARKGYAVTIFDAKPQPGGLLVYGIPNFKLEKDVVFARIDDIFRMGVKFVGNTFIGKDKTVDQLLDEDGFEAVFIAVGTWVDSPMKAEGVDLPGVWNGTEYLIRTNVKDAWLPDDMMEKIDIGKKVVVIGGGDTAADCLRTSVRLNADEVTCLYRRTENEMPGGYKDRNMAREEGVNYSFLTQPVKFLEGEDGKLCGVECLKMELGEPDDSGRRRPVAIEGSEFVIETDTAVLALGYWPDETIGKTTPDLEIHDWGLITADAQTGATSREGIFAGGDAVTGPDLVVTAMKAGARSAEAIHEYILAKQEK